jgi:predicted lactoylglutathione lyase
MKLGAFSISLNVKDLETSKTFYEALGFSVFGGNMDNRYLILKNGNAIIGLFQGLFEGNILTFNPKWDENSNAVDGDDVRDIQKQLQEKGISVDVAIDPQNAGGPASITLKDPDGNVILIDQHV